MLGIGPWDWAAIGVYLLGITALGVWTARKVKDTDDFFMGGRRFNRWFMIFFAFGAGTSGNDAVGVSSKTYTSGMSGIWYQWLWLFATPFYWLIAPVFRRMRALTTGDYFEQRYDGGVAALYSVVSIFSLTVNMGVLLLGGGKMIQAVSQGAIDYRVAVAGMTVMFLLYGMAGGLGAAIVTDFIQGILTIILSFMLLPQALRAVGYMTGLREQIRDEHMFSLAAPGEINLFHIVMMGVIALIGIVTQPHIMGVCAAGRTEMDGRWGFAGGNIIKRFCTIPWMLVGLCGVVLYPGLTGKDPDLVYGMVARDLLPGILPGLVGMFLAALLASIMSSCDAFMVSCSGLFTQNLYRRFLAPDRSQGHYVLVGRITSFFLVMGGLSFAFLVPDVPRGLELFFKLQAMMGAAFWLGLFWRGATVAGAWAGTLAGVLVLAVTENFLFDFHAWAVANLPETMIWNNAFRYSWSILFYLSTSFVAAVLVSLATPRVPKPQLDRLFDCLRTPIAPNEPHVAPFTLPEGVAPGPPNKLINHPDWEIPRPSLIGMAGFVSIWALVAVLIGFVYWIASLGK